MKIEIEMLPPVECSPNWRGHWAQRYRAAQEFKSAVFYHCLDARNREMTLTGTWVPFQRAIMNLTFIFPHVRERDENNIIARFKPGQDAIVSAGFIPNDSPAHLIRGRLEVLVDPERSPLTIIEMEEASG